MGQNMCNDVDAHDLLKDVSFGIFSLHQWQICMIFSLQHGQKTDHLRNFSSLHV
jgi:hypothetical protein